MEGKNNNKKDMVILMGCILLLFLGCLAFFFRPLVYHGIRGYGL